MCLTPQRIPTRPVAWKTQQGLSFSRENESYPHLRPENPQATSCPCLPRISQPALPLPLLTLGSSLVLAKMSCTVRQTGLGPRSAQTGWVTLGKPLNLSGHLCPLVKRSLSSSWVAGRRPGDSEGDFRPCSMFPVPWGCGAAGVLGDSPLGTQFPLCAPPGSSAQGQGSFYQRACGHLPSL